jgi:acetyl-CoA acetyltransferase
MLTRAVSRLAAAANFRNMIFTQPARELSRQAAIVGVGDTDYALDYQAGRTKPEGYQPATVESLAKTAFERALADAGLRRADVDGISLCAMPGPGPRAIAPVLGLEPRYIGPGGFIMDDVIPPAVEALASGKCETIALVYASPSRSAARVYGGQTYGGDREAAEGTPFSYYYFHPWGWSSQAAHWAFMFTYYQGEYGVSEEDLGSVALTLRRHAARNDNAIMRKPLTTEDYLRSRYVVAPLRLYDLCLVNDGGVCLILRRADLAQGLAHPPVEVAGWGHAQVKRRKLHQMVRERLRPQFQEAGAAAFGMAGLTPRDVRHFQGYDASSFHLVDQLEGYGFAEPGQGMEFFKDGQADLGGQLPVNTSGGMLSEAYMHGWNHVAEAVRQLRHEAGPSQVPGLQVSLFSMATTESAHPLILTRGES